jgi:hypothetical protein
MGALRTYRSFLFVVPVLFLLGFYPFIRASPKRVLATIFDNCLVATKDSVCKPGEDRETTCASIGDTVIWTPTDTGHGYSANFRNSTGTTKTPFHVSDSSGAPVPVVSAGPQGQLVTGDGQCNANNASACYFPYDIYRYDTVGNSAKCGDPGVRVVPPSAISLASWLRSWFVSLFTSSRK